MAERQLKPETQARLREVVDRIAGEHGLPAETHDELAAHLEDKALAYLSGELAISEADALFLAQQHLGNPKSLGVQLARTSPRLSFFPRPLMQRLLVATIAFFICNTLAAFLYAYVFLPHFVIAPFEFAVERRMPFNTAGLQYASILAMLIGYLPFPLLLKVLAPVLTRNIRFSVLMLGGVCLLNLYAASRPGLFSAMANTSYTARIPLSYPSNMFYSLRDAAYVIGPLCLFVIWLRYCCRIAMTLRILLISCVGWFLAMALVSITYNAGLAVDRAQSFGPAFAWDQSTHPLVWMLGEMATQTFHLSAQFLSISFAFQVPLAIVTIIVLVWRQKRSLAKTMAVIS
jgi:hypothetical protein